MATKKKPSALNAAKLRIQELETRLEEQKSSYIALDKELQDQRSTNKALFLNLEELKEKRRKFDEETSEYEGMRTFLLEKLRNKRTAYVHSLFTNVKETINTAHHCKADKLREDLKSLMQRSDMLSLEISEVEKRRL